MQWAFTQPTTTTELQSAPTQQIIADTSTQQYVVYNTTNQSPRKRGRAPGAANWTPSDVMLMLYQVDVVRPRSTIDWDNVAKRFNKDRAADSHKSTEMIRSKFYKLSSKPVPTGNPTIPEDIRTAKWLRTQIGNSVAAHCNAGDDSDSDATPQIVDTQESNQLYQQHTSQLSDVSIPCAQPNRPILPDINDTHTIKTHTKRKSPIKSSYKRQRVDLPTVMSTITSLMNTQNEHNAEQLAVVSAALKQQSEMFMKLIERVIPPAATQSSIDSNQST